MEYTEILSQTIYRYIVYQDDKTFFITLLWKDGRSNYLVNCIILLVFVHLILPDLNIQKTSKQVLIKHVKRTSQTYNIPF